MTAITHTTTTTEVFGGELQTADGVAAELEDFLRDPIGHGDFDYDDPISFDEFSTSRHMRTCYAAAIV